MSFFKRFNPRPASDPKSKRKQKARHGRHSTKCELSELRKQKANG